MPNISAQALYTACAAGDAAAVSRLLPAGGTRLNLSAPPFKDPGTTSTPLMVAAFRGYTEVVRVLLERAPNTAVDAMNGNGGTALMATAWLHHADILRLLADHGANVNFMDQWRHTPLRQAVAPMLSDPSPRDPDPDGARQVATVRALLRLGAGTPPPFLPSPSPLSRTRSTISNFDTTSPPQNPLANHGCTGPGRNLSTLLPPHARRSVSLFPLSFRLPPHAYLTLAHELIRQTDPSIPLSTQSPTPSTTWV
jgi:hypothetical protein